MYKYNYATGKKAKRIHINTLEGEENGFYPYVDNNLHYGIYREGDKYICFDNSSNQCWSEEYSGFDEAYAWLTQYQRPTSNTLGVRSNYRESVKISLFIDHWQENNLIEESNLSKHNALFKLEFNSFLEKEIKDKQLIELFKV